VVPIFVAVMVWLIRVLIIGTFSVAGDRLFSQAARSASRSTYNPAQARPQRPYPAEPAQAFRPAPKAAQANEGGAYMRAEPTYHPVSMSGYRRR